MKEILQNLICSVLLCIAGLTTFAQVKLLDSGVTKIYPNNTRITYCEVTDFPNSDEMRDFVAKILLQDPDIIRLIVYKNYKTVFYEARPQIEPNMIVDAINDAIALYNADDSDNKIENAVSTNDKTQNAESQTQAETKVYDAKPVKMSKQPTQFVQPAKLRTAANGNNPRQEQILLNTKKTSTTNKQTTETEIDIKNVKRIPINNNSNSVNKKSEYKSNN